MDGLKIGYLPQEPKLDPTKTVFENIAAKCPEKMMVDEFNAISVKLGEEYTDELMEQMTKLQEEIDAANAWDIDAKIEMAMEALRCPPGDCRRDQALGRRDPPHRDLRAAAVQARHDPDGRTDQPPRR